MALKLESLNGCRCQCQVAGDWPLPQDILDPQLTSYGKQQLSPLVNGSCSQGL